MRSINPFVQFDTEYLKQNIPIEQVIEMYAGVKVDAHRNRQIKCPSPDHADKHPSAQIYHDKNICKCFSCGGTFDPISLARAYNPTMHFTDLLYKLSEDFGIPLEVCSDIAERQNAAKERRPIFAETFPLKYAELEELGFTVNEKDETARSPHDVTDYVQRMHRNIGNTDYHRGLSQATLDRFQVGYDAAWHNPTSQYDRVYPRIIIPTSDHSYLARLAVKLPDKEDEKRAKCRKVGNTELFNEAALHSGKPVFIVEGEIDAMSVCDVGGEAIGIGGVGNVSALLERFSENKPTQPFVISMDNDNAGIKAKQALVEGFDKLGITYIVADVSAPCKDANEALCNDREGFAKRVQDTMLYVSRLKGKEKLIPPKVKEAMESIEVSPQKQPAGTVSVQQIWREGDVEGKTRVENELLEKISTYIDQYKALNEECMRSHAELTEKYTPEQWQKNLFLLEKYNDFVEKNPSVSLRMTPTQLAAVRDAASLTWSEKIGMQACEKMQHFMDMRDKILTQQEARERFYQEHRQNRRREQQR